MQKCLVEINRGNISVYKLSLSSCEKEIVYSKSFKYYKEINELLISRYIRNILAVLSEVETLPKLKNIRFKTEVKVVLESNKKVIRAIRNYFIKRENFELEIIDKRKYKIEMYRKLSRGVINIWEVGGSLYIGYINKDIRIVSELISVFENKNKLDMEYLFEHLIYYDLPSVDLISSVSIKINDNKLKELICNSFILMGYSCT